MSAADKLEVQLPADSGAKMAANMNRKTSKCDRGAAGSARAHFRIDWRQLSYFHANQSHSALPGAQLLARLTGGCNKRPTAGHQHHQQHQQHHKVAATADGELGEEAPARGRKRILNSLDGCFKSGELNAILGPSGAGKSTFLSALFGNKQEAAYGQTKVTWLTQDRRAESQLVDKRRLIRIAFLPQQDHLLNHLTVYETLMFASKIKNPQQANNASFHRSNVRRVAKMLKLTDCFGTRCGQLSGGQYKRVSIGQELLSEPDVIILDEPTSGLDAMTCLTTIRTLKSIATKQPISIILTIHQPDVDVFNLFDRVYVIAQGGMAIYEGPPGELAPTMARANLFMPSETYNPARFIVENAFVADLESSASEQHAAGLGAPSLAPGQPTAAGLSSSEEEDEGAESDEDEAAAAADKSPGLLKRSLSSITEALNVVSKQPAAGADFEPVPGARLRATGKCRDSGRRPLLNIGIQTADGKLITSDALLLERQQGQANELRAKELASRLELLKRLNELQKARYYRNASPTSAADLHDEGHESSGSHLSASGEPLSWLSADSTDETASGPNASLPSRPSAELGDDCPSSSSASSVSSYSEARETFVAFAAPAGAGSSPPAQAGGARDASVAIPMMDGRRAPLGNGAGGGGGGGKRAPLRRFDKRLSARHSQSKRSNYPIWYHSFLLTHRTWLSIVRDPIFFGIQFTMHTTIPILLALIFGSQQEEGCPQVGNFDLVEFAYQTNRNDLIASTMRSIRQSIGNVGIIFFEMFVLSFAINCITALVFPLDMHVLLKEYRNGWYSLRSYFFGRTLADLPVPVLLHSLAMSILYYLTGQPFTWWRFWAVIGIVILASLVAQSVGLTIGALLMRSSQSAVLAAAGIVAPFFALSGFIVRIHTLPWAAQLAAKSSYLYHLLNGFIILRYGFERCDCKQEDFAEQAEAHKIPENLKTMASMWIGTYSNEFEETSASLARHSNRTNVDPNIDIIDKLMGAFKLANSFGHKVETCADVMPYAMLDFNLKDADLAGCCLALLLMLLVSRLITFSAIYYKIRSVS